MLRFELKKLWRRKQFLILTLIVIACIATIFFRNYWSQDDIVDQAFQSMSPHSMSVAEIENTYRNEMMFHSDDDNLDEAFIAEHDNAQLMSDKLSQWQETIRNREWDQIPEAEMAFIQTVLKHNEYGETYEGYGDDELEQSIKRNEILLEHSLPYEHELYSLSTTNFMKVVFIFLLSVPGLAILIFLLGDLLVTEKERSTIRTLATQPIPKWRLILGKFAGQLSAVVFTLVIIILASFMIPLLFCGQMGSFSYPQLIHDSDGFEFISIGRYLLLYMILFLGAASVAFSLVLLFSTLFKDRLIVLFSALITLFGGVYVTNQFTVLQSVSNPFLYFNFQSFIEEQGQLSHPLFLAIPYVIALLILLITTILQKQKHSEEKGKSDLLPFDKGLVSKKESLFSTISMFEWRKLKREGQVKRFTIIILLLIIGGYAVITLSTHQLREQYIARTEQSISNANEQISNDKQIIENSEEVLDELDKRESSLTGDEEMLKEIAEGEVLGYSESLSRRLGELERTENELGAYKQGNWMPVYESWQEELAKWWKDPLYESNYPTEKSGGGLSDITFQASTEKIEWMMEHELQPVHNSYFLPYTWTIHDKFISPMDQLKWYQDLRKIDNTGLFYVYTLFTTPSYLILMGLLVFLLGIGMTAEKGVKRTLTFLTTQPVRISGIYLSKTWISMLLAISIAVGSLFMMVLTGIIGNRFGDWKFPVLHYDPVRLVEAENYTGFLADEGGFHFMYMGKFLLETGALFLMGLLFLIAISHFFSLFFKHSMSSLFATFIVAVSGYAVSAFTPLSSIAHWSPFTYLNVGKIANGELAIVLENEEVTTISGVVALLVGTVILIGIGLVYARSRWMKVT